MRPGKLPEPPLKRAVFGQLKEGISHKEKNIGVGCDAGFGIFREKCLSEEVTDGEKGAGKRLGNFGEREAGERLGNFGEREAREQTEDCRENVWIYAQDTVLYGAESVDLFFGFHRGANSILAAGGLPRWVTVTLMLPENWQEPEIRSLMAEIDALCAERNVEILGGQTETLPGLANPLITLHFMGTKYRRDFPLQTEAGKVRPKDAIVMSGFPAADLAGKWLVKKREILEKRFCPAFLAQAEERVFGGSRWNCGNSGPNPDERNRNSDSNPDERNRSSDSNPQKLIREVRNMEHGSGETDYPSIEKAACLAMDFGVKSMHDIGEGGVFGALRELGEREGCGLAVDLKKIPVLQEVIELCEVFDRNPYLTKSCGALLMVTPDPEGLVRTLGEADVSATVIGQITDDKKMTIYREDEIRYLDHPQMDECWR